MKSMQTKSLVIANKLKKISLKEIIKTDKAL